MCLGAQETKFFFEGAGRELEEFLTDVCVGGALDESQWGRLGKLIDCIYIFYIYLLPHLLNLNFLF